MKFKIGDRVKIVYNASVREHSYWVSSMDETIGEIGKIVKIYGSSDKTFYTVETNNISWAYPECALKKVDILPDNLFTLD